MSSHSFPKIDQKEYLKKYLSGDKVKKKKKDKKHKKSSASVKVKIIDDDINHLDSGLQIDEELFLTGEDAPQIVGEYIEEKLCDSKIPKWKSIVVKEEPEQDETAGDLWGCKKANVKVKQEFGVAKKRSKNTSDISPPRRKDRKRPTSSPSSPRRPRNSMSPARKSKNNNLSFVREQNDQSPQRRSSIDTSIDRRRLRSPDQSPSRRKKHRDQSFDASPPRRGRKNSDQSPARENRNYSTKERKHSSDISPARRRRNSDQSPPRKGRFSPTKDRKCSPDQSPPRQKRNSSRSPLRYKKMSLNRSTDRSPLHRNRNSDQSPPRRNSQKSDYLDQPQQRRRNSDQSPPHRNKNSADQSPPRRRRDSGQSPPRKSRKHSSDQSPLRRRHNSPPRTSRNSPPFQIKREKLSPQLSPTTAAPPRRSRWERQEPEKSPSPPPTHKPKPLKTLEGKRAGLQDAQALQRETKERRKQEDQLFEKMSSDISGRNAEVQVRSTGRKGRRAREAREEDPEERQRKEAHEEKKKLLYDRWGKGLKQIEDHKQRLLEQEHESSKPLARYSHDEDLERHLKEQERAEDPMLEYMRQKRKDKEKQSGKPQIPRYEGSFPENRFGIRPGYRWDGVDRSNGYEKKYFDVQNEKRARQDEAYKYSVEDM